MISTSPSLASRLNSPFLSVCVPPARPLTVTLAPSRGLSPGATTTFPVIFLGVSGFCAYPPAEKRRRLSVRHNKRSNALLRFRFFILQSSWFCLYNRQPSYGAASGYRIDSKIILYVDRRGSAASK